MAKDEKGHGSDARGGGFKAHDGKTYELAHRPGLYAHLGMTDAQSTQAVSDKNAAAELAQGNPKAGVAPINNGIQGNKLEPGTANAILHDTNSHDRDFHTLRSDQTLRLADYAKQFGYRKSASSPGSTARAFHNYLSNRRDKEIRASNAQIKKHFGT